MDNKRFCSVQLIPGSSPTTCSHFLVNQIENHLQIPLKLNKSLELGSSLPTPPPTHPIINQSGLSQSELPINVEDVNQPMGVADESNVENSNLPQRGVVLIKKGFHSRFRLVNQLDHFFLSNERASLKTHLRHIPIQVHLLPRLVTRLRMTSPW